MKKCKVYYYTFIIKILNIIPYKLITNKVYQFAEFICKKQKEAIDDYNKCA